MTVKKVQKASGSTITGPFFKSSAPFGEAIPSMNRNEWYVSRPLRADEIDSLGLGETCLGVIVQYHDQPDRFIISRSHPTKEFSTLKKAIKYLEKPT